MGNRVPLCQKKKKKKIKFKVHEWRMCAEALVCVELHHSVLCMVLLSASCMDWPFSFPFWSGSAQHLLGVLTGSTDKFQDKGANIPPKFWSQSVLSHTGREITAAPSVKAT